MILSCTAEVIILFRVIMLLVYDIIIVRRRRLHTAVALARLVDVRTDAKVRRRNPLSATTSPPPATHARDIHSTHAFYI